MSTEYRLGRLRLYRRGPIYHIRGTHEGEIIRRSTGSDDIRVARVALDDLYAELQSGWRTERGAVEASWSDVAKWVCARHKMSAKERGIPFDLIPSEIYTLMRESMFRCAISGISYSRRVGPGLNGAPDPWSASMDRIESRHGYVRGNIRIVCLIANVAMNRWGYDALLRLANGVARNANHVLPEPEENLEKTTLCASEIGLSINEIN